ncbi:hypothetical protein GCM10009715_21830 [Paeniglutamicibacter psychrophenolicus]|uniref:Nitrate reductase NapE component n=1 Tax=Paeniglutamicibacter psychrophenolicus TaxID=257454 RepID=A0ABS4WHL1_9MICC|nr:hypothetical protein [Paeniglutamicibacter psychrophenolicus]MBP2375618.1 nitrate reductase NapE component [Paeniglutamicibacter psychrophenolicus]
MQETITAGAFIVANWALSITALRMVSKSEYATKLTKEAAAFTILTFTIFTVLASAAVTGYSTFGTPSGVLLTIWIFLAPFMVALSYALNRRKKLTVEELKDESPKRWTIIVLVLWVVLGLVVILGADWVNNLHWFKALTVA